MKLPDGPSVQAWLALAASDLRIARVLLPLEPPEFPAVCFHAQQAGEKALKALLEAHDRAIPRSHDLIALARLLETVGLPASEIAREAAILSEYGVLPRYPMPTGRASDAEAREAVDAADVVLAWVQRQLSSGGGSG